MGNLLPVLAIILFGARAASLAAQKFGLPGVLGELMLGLTLGPLVINRLHAGGEISTLGSLGVLMLMLLVGLETDFESVKSVGRTAFCVAFLGALLPVVFGFLAARALGESDRVSFFIGVALSATSVSITAATLRELGKLNSIAGQTILVAAVLDDILVLLLVSFVGGSTGGSPLGAGLKMVAFLVIAMGGGALALKPILKKLESHMTEFLAVAIGLAMLYAWAAERFCGLAGITGAYIAGILLARAMPHQRVARDVEVMASGFFATLFFVSIGLTVHLGDVRPMAIVGLTILALLTKLVGCGVGAFATGLSRKDSLVVGVGMAPRGEVALIVASIGLQKGVLHSAIFSDLVLVVILTTVLTPLLLKIVYGLTDRGHAAATIAPAPTGGLAPVMLTSKGSD